MYPEQTNTKQGDLVVIAGDDLSAKAGCLVKISNDGGVAKAYLPDALTDVACYVVLEGAEAGSHATLRPLESGRSVRVVANSTTIVAGDKIVGYASGHEGEATEYSAGDAFIVGVAEQAAATAGQLVLIRPILSFLNND